MTARSKSNFAHAELITKYPKAAGAALHVSRAFGSRFDTFVVTLATVALAFGGHFLELVQSFLSIPLLVAALIFVIVLAYVNFRGISEPAKVTLAMSIAEIAGLALVRSF